MAQEEISKLLKISYFSKAKIYDFNVIRH